MRLRHSSPIYVLALSLLVGCGGGGGSANIQSPPPPTADFSISLSSNSLSLPQGTAAPITISIAAQNGFTGNVQVTLAGLPTGVVSNPGGAVSISSGASASIVFGAAANAATGNFTVTAQGTSGSLSHSATLMLAVQAGSASSLPLTTYLRTDSVPAFDAPPGEAHHRHIVYDAVNHHVFVANRAMNRLEVFSSADQSRVAQITVPAASSADLSPDGATLWVGTTTEQAIAIDTARLKIRSRYSIPPLVPIPNTVFNRPEELLPMSSGKILMRLRQTAAPQALLALWDPVANTLADLTSVVPALFQNGLGAMARTGDHTKILVAANDSTGQAAILDATGAILTSPQSFGTGTIPLVAANPDGSRFALEFVSAGVAQLFLLDSALNQAATLVSFSAQSLSFSRDGNFLYASAGVNFGPPFISIFDGHTLQLIGQVPGASIQGIPSEIEDADETQLLFAVANRGVSFIDASKPVALPSTVPSFVAAPAALPSEGPFTGGTATSLAGQNFESSAQIKFGPQLASVSAVNPAQIQLTSPPSVVDAAVNITAYFPSGWLAVAPDAFSYAPQILEILPNAGSPAGGDAVQIYGYGFGSDPSRVTAKFGSATATAQNVESVASIAPSLALDSTYPFSLQRITLLTPPGSSGPADVTITSPAGVIISSRAFQYLHSAQVFAKPALYKFVLYDQKRQWLYLSSTDHVDVFDLSSSQFRSTDLTPPGGPPPSAALRGLALTPDASQLVVADFGAQNIYLLNPDSAAGTTVPVGGISGFLNSGPARVAATSAQTVFVAMSGEGGSSACSSCLSQLNLSATPPSVQPAPQPEVTSLTGTPLVQAAATGGTVFLAYDSAPAGPFGIWSASSPNQFITSITKESAIDLAAASDATVFASRTSTATEVHSPDLTLRAIPANPELEQIPARVLIPGLALHSSGALLYQPFLTGPAPAAPPATGIQGGVDIIDTHTGQLRLRLFLPEPLAALSTDIDALHGSFLAIDENGQRIFALTTSGLTVVDLAAVPLSIGTISPSSASVAGGTFLSIRGSGFQSGAAVTISGKSAATVFKDVNTLTITIPPLLAGPQQITITNPNGDSYSLDAAFTAN